MIRILFFTAVISLSIISCNSNEENPKKIVPKPINAEVDKNDTCRPYFNFDHVDHYFLDISDERAQNPDSMVVKTKAQRKLMELLTNFFEGKTLDSTAFGNLQSLNFIKTVLPTNKFEKINELFCERKHNTLQYTACRPIFRDILIFKNHNKIIGIAKICFKCGEHTIVGTNCNTEEFGQSGDYGKLKQVLHE